MEERMKHSSVNTAIPLLAKDDDMDRHLLKAKKTPLALLKTTLLPSANHGFMILSVKSVKKTRSVRLDRVFRRTTSLTPRVNCFLTGP